MPNQPMFAGLIFTPTPKIGNDVILVKQYLTIDFFRNFFQAVSCIQQ